MSADVVDPVAALLSEGERKLGAVTDRPRHEAFRLLQDVVGGPLAVVNGAPVSETDRGVFAERLLRRAGGEPLAYIEERAGFRNLDLRVDCRVLIPRPETEGLVELVLDAVGMRQTPRVLDIGTGSGCIALSLASELSGAEVMATDISQRALAVARANAARNRIEGIDFRLGSLFESLDGKRFDAIVSNPPYIARDEYELLDPSVRHYEPERALVSPGGGMWHIRRMLERGGEYLSADGVIALEIDSRRSDRSAEIALSNGWDDVRVTDDLTGRPRFLTARRRRDG